MIIKCDRAYQASSDGFAWPSRADEKVKRWQGPPAPGHGVEIASLRWQWVRDAHGHDDVVNCLTGCSGVRFVLQKRCVGDDGDCWSTMWPGGPAPTASIVGVSICGEDDEWLTAEVGQQRRLLHRRRPVEKLLDEAREVPGGRRIGARLVPRAWRKTAIDIWATRRPAPRCATAGNNADARPTKL